MFSSPPFAPLITHCRTNAYAAPIPAPINTIGGIRAATGPGAIKTPTPARPAPIAEGPMMINRGGHTPAVLHSFLAFPETRAPRVAANPPAPCDGRDYASHDGGRT